MLAVIVCTYVVDATTSMRVVDVFDVVRHASTLLRLGPSVIDSFSFCRAVITSVKVCTYVAIISAY
jgi:hypothetical protein